jgi:hypothetical protein
MKRDTILVHLIVVGPYHAHAGKHLWENLQGILVVARHAKSVILKGAHLQSPKGQLMWDFGYAQERLVTKLSNNFPTTTMRWPTNKPCLSMMFPFW